ncbi:MAG: CRISPR-associated protein Cas4 [bacterium]
MANITTSDVIEYLYCPRFIYFIYCLGIKQNEDKRYKVIKGREVHKNKASSNKSYLRKRLNVVKKEIEVPLNSEKYHIHGIIDEVLFLNDGTASPFDYKFAEYKEKLFSTYKYQSYIYALLITENYNIPVNTGYICYTRSNNLIKEIEYNEKGLTETIEIINNVIKIIEKGLFPKKTNYSNKCIDCCYKNICVK